MLRRFRRFLIVLASAMLVLPLGVGLMEPRDLARSADELRPLAPWPTWPRKHREWRALPRMLDAYLADHFGLRRDLIRLHALVAYRWLGNGNDQVLVGRRGRLFYLGESSVAQSAGLVMRADQVRQTVETVSRMRDVLAARGVKFLGAVPPNAATVYDDDLPLWARNHGQPAEPDLVLRGLQERGVIVVDLRTALRAGRAKGNMYLRHDTHWTDFGALIAFNAVAVAAGHADWRFDPEEALTPPGAFEAGDLARMLGLGHDLPEQTPLLAVGAGSLVKFGPETEPFELSTSGLDGPSVFVLGDSFTEGTFAALGLEHTGRFGWLKNRNCDFDWSWIDAFRPDEVWWMPTERYILCNPGTRPKGMPADVARKDLP